jgi:hypothetical protein
LLTFFAAAKKVSAAPHRGEANRPLRIQGKANTAGTQPTRREAKSKTQHYKTLTNKLKTIDKTRVDINGNGYSFPNILRVTSPGIRPTPNFLSQGQQLDKMATATNVVNNHRIIAIP